MVTLVTQFAVALATLAFAVAAYRVARSPRGMHEPLRAAWIVVASAFLWRAVPGMLHTTAAVWAFAAGEGSAAWERFASWSAVPNFAQTAVAVAMGWALLATLPLRGMPARTVWWGAGAVAAAVFAAGACAGWRWGPPASGQVTAFAVLSAVELIGLLWALTAGLFFHTMDRYLWACMCAYSVQVALNVFWYSALTGFFHGEWYPPPSLMKSYTLASYLLGLAVAHRRLALARRGVRVPGLMEAPGAGIPFREVA